MTFGARIDDPTKELSYTIDREGRYVSASPTMLTLLGWTIDDLPSLHVGAATGQPEVARALWRRFQAGRFPPPVGDPALLHGRAGQVIPAVLVDVERTPADTFTLRYRLADPEVVGRVRQAEAPDVLTAWREAERRLAAMPSDDRGRDAAIEDGEDWRLISQAAQARPRSPR